MSKTPQLRTTGSGPGLTAQFRSHWLYSVSAALIFSDKFQASVLNGIHSEAILTGRGKHQQACMHCQVIRVEWTPY